MSCCEMTVSPSFQHVRTQIQQCRCLNLLAQDTGWRLQVQTNDFPVGLSTNWLTLPGSDATNYISVPIDPDNGSVFYWLVSP